MCPGPSHAPPGACADPFASVGARDGSAIDLVLKSSAGPGKAMGVADNLEFTVMQVFGD
jgi:hypothetical protein